MRDVVVFNGIKFTRYPNSKSLSGRRYYYPDKRYRQLGVGALHQEIWKQHHGPVPKGMEIHHKDNNHLNNDISNLECLTASEHTLRHAGSTPARRAAVARIRSLTKEWHGSEEGRKWHSEHGKKTWSERVIIQQQCEHCGEFYESECIGRNQRWCSKSCRQKHHYKDENRQVTRNCEICSNSFLVYKYSKGTTCSRSCRTTLQHRRRNA